MHYEPNEATVKDGRLSTEVSALLDTNRHPLRKEIDLLRTIILASHGSISEGVKWNAASFRTTEWFATLNGPKQIKEPMIILHAGAKAKGHTLKGRIPDPDGLLNWLGNDRAQILLKDHRTIQAKRKALGSIIHTWVEILLNEQP
jgi:hypothetical protein